MSLSPASPEERFTALQYRQVRDYLLDSDPDASEFKAWTDDKRSLPETPEDCAGEIIWIILCAGRSAQAARTLEKKIWHAISRQEHPVTVFRYRKKADAIQRAWRERRADHARLLSFDPDDIEGILAWCVSLPFIGDITKYQLAKNFGFDLCKPDIWLCRLAGIADHNRIKSDERFRRCMAFCAQIANATGDSIALIDSMLWLGCNKGIVTVSSEAGPVSVHLWNGGGLKRGTIYSPG